MYIENVQLSREYGLEGNATLKCFLHETEGELAPYNKDLPAIIVVPGGGYHWVSLREADPIALWYFAHHYNAYVLDYSVAPARYPAALTELAAAVDYVKRNAEKQNVDPGRVFAVGFSAGGHLVGCLANFCDDLPVPTAGGKKLDARPAAVVLGYPVIYYDSHVGSFVNLTGENECTPLCEKLSLDAQVTPAHPPAFLWTTATDTCVDPLATVRYTAALLKCGVRVESHIFPSGSHGGATCDIETIKEDSLDKYTSAHGWLALSDAFLKSIK